MRVLSVAEKPSVAKELANIIGNGQYNQYPSPSPYNKIFEIVNCPFRNGNVSMRITSVTGHLMEAEFDPRYRSWTACPPGDLFHAPINKQVKSENINVKRNLMDEARNCNVLLLWLDCDLEGENIAYEVIQVCTEVNPRLDIYRARFSALIPRDIMRALKFPDRPNPLFNAAVEARIEIDLRLGAAFTRFQTQRLQNKWEGLNSMVSYGPCQFPTLGFVVDRHLQIQKFRPEEYWSLKCTYECDEPTEKSGKLHCSFNWSRGLVYDKFTTLILFDLCNEDGGSAKVIACDSRPTSHTRPCPMNTIELQKRASRLLRLSSERTMHVAEALYQRGIMSYPRTETDFFKEGFDIHTLLQEHRGHSLWGDYTTQLLDQNKFLWPRNGGHDDQAHPPIHPTKCVELNELHDPDEKAIYELVVRHFLASCGRDALGHSTNIKIQIPASGLHTEQFAASGLMVVERNWLDVYQKWEHWSASKVPKFQVGDVFVPKSLTMTTGRTAPPQNLSESELIGDMDKHGIGTDATIATHITTIQQREYVLKDDQNRFIPTKLGIALIEAYNSMGYQLNKPFLRAQMEADCQKIARGECRKEDVIRNCLEQMKICYDTCLREADKLDQAMLKYFARLGAAETNDYVVVKARFSNCGVCEQSMDLKVREADLHVNQGGHESGNDDDENDAYGGQNGGGGRGRGRGRGRGAPERGGHRGGQGGGRGRGRGGNGPDGIVSRYLHCATCQRSHFLPGRGTLSTHEARCAICNFQVLTVKNEETGKEHTVCPFCFKSPPGPPVSEEGASELRCMSCAHSTCILAGRLLGADVDIAPCYDLNCSGQMRLKKTRAGFMFSCTQNACKSVWWVPKAVRSVRPVDNTCRNCTVTGRIVRKLTFEFNLQAAPPNTPTEATICPCCDILWSNLDVSPLRLRTITTATRAHNNANLRGQSSGYNHTLQQYQQYQQQTYQPQTYRPQPQQNYQQSPYLHQQLQQQVQPRSYQSSQGLPPSLPQGEQLPLYNQPNYQQHQQQQQYQTGQPSGQPSGQLDPRMEGW